ncbi:MAG TPA: CvpA family protein [bacterium]|jgi:membrane protein required for colicin V production|nr:CvpA family protein [bacterium]
MNTLDYILLAIMALAALRCWFRGIIGEVLSTAAVIGGLLSGIFFFRPVGAWISSLVTLGGFEPVVGFVAAFALVFIVVKIVERSLRGVLESLHLDILDRILGLVFGALEGVIMAAIIVLVLKFQPLFNVTQLLDGSVVARVLLPLLTERMPQAKSAIDIFAAFSKKV